MHPTALSNASEFFRAYASGRSDLAIVEIGSLDINGSLRSVSPPQSRYLGVDFAAGAGVDLVLEDPYAFPIPDTSQDMVVSSSCFEHSQMFWLVFLEIMRILKPDGVFYLNAPSNGPFHRFPVDCWRFYPDASEALATWGRRSGYPVVLLESYTSGQDGSYFNDFVAVYLRDSRHQARHPTRILDSFTHFTNGRVHGKNLMLNPQALTEDQQRLVELGHLR